MLSKRTSRRPGGAGLLGQMAATAGGGPALYWSIQQESFADRCPLALISGRLAEYEGGGDETRSNVWLAELQQQMFAEVNPEDAAAAGIRPGAMIRVHSPEASRARGVMRDEGVPRGHGGRARGRRRHRGALWRLRHQRRGVLLDAGGPAVSAGAYK